MSSFCEGLIRTKDQNLFVERGDRQLRVLQMGRTLHTDMLWLTLYNIYSYNMYNLTISIFFQCSCQSKIKQAIKHWQ